jgi:RNA polymerase sigma-70 factor (ECF subfamily)
MASSSTDDSRALTRLVREHRLALVRIARAEGLGAEDAVDCVHDAFCHFLSVDRKPSARDSGAPLILAAMVRNAARNKRRRHHLARAHRPLESAELPAVGPEAEALVAHAEDCVRLQGCVERLAASQREVVLMRLLEERPGEDVAAALGLTRGHVDVLLHRAKASLLSCMTEG